MYESNHYTVERFYAIIDMYAARAVPMDFMRGFKAVLDLKNGADTKEAATAKDMGLRV